MLVLDGMATRKFAGYDPQLKAYMGMCTIQDEDELEDVHEQLVTECLVFMLVGVDPRWKKRLPVGYWFTRHNTAHNVGNLVKETLQFSHQHRIDVVGLVFDGLVANIAMVNKLGANIKLDDLKNSFPHPITGDPVFVMLDAPHMMKLSRNLIGEYDLYLDISIYLDIIYIWISGFNLPATWRDFLALLEKQEETGLKSGNRFTRNNAEYHTNKMKVSLAVQTLSESVATTLDDGRDDLFPGSEATSFFARTMNELFDFWNSRSPRATGTRTPLRPENFEEKKERMNGILEIYQNLKLRPHSKFCMTY